MNDQLQDLLQRVYEEGVVKAKAEADGILDKARSEAEQIVSKAKSEADALLAEANKKAQELGKNTDSDLKMAAQHTISSVKQKITEVILQQVFDARLKQDFADPEFLKKLILEVLQAWKESGGRITIAQSMEPKLDEYFLGSLKQVVGSQLVVEFSPKMKNGFSISPQDNSFKLSFTDEDFANLFKSYLRPRTSQILFEQ